MHTYPQAVLSISLRRNRLGFAVFRHGQLRYYAVKTFNGDMTRLERKRAFVSLLSGLIATHQAEAVVLPRLNQQQRNSLDLRYLHASVLRYCLTKRLPVRIQDPMQVRQSVCGIDKAIKRNVVSHLMKVYPELARFNRSGSEWETKYYHHVITAIAGGVAYDQ